MALAIVEYDFFIEYYPGVWNVIADFSSRQLDPSEWEDDDEGVDLDDFLVSVPFDVVTDLPSISMSDYTAEDFEEFQYFKLTHEEKDGMIAVKHQGGGGGSPLCQQAENSFLLDLSFPKA